MSQEGYSPEQAGAFEESRENYQQKWEDEAQLTNEQRVFYKKFLGLDEVTAEDAMLKEADADNVLHGENHNKPGSMYVEIDFHDPEIKNKIAGLRSGLNLSGSMISRAEEERDARGENVYRAPELDPRNQITPDRFVLMMLDELEEQGTINFHVFSLKHKDMLNSEESMYAFAKAGEKIIEKLGLDKVEVTKAA